jgi:uncharacterized protein (TIGR00661 family)
MNQPFAGKKTGKPRILVAPLDWGLGHATRCIPVIRELLQQDVDVWLAGEGVQEDLLKKEFPQLPFLSLPGYRIRYARSAVGLLLKIFSQTFKISEAIKKENKWLKKMVNEYSFDAVISDNRYGLYHKKIPTVFITHQLLIKNPLGKWNESFLQKINYNYISRFTECWVPDEEGETNLAGQLSHPVKKPAVPVHYIGLMSRMKRESVNAYSENEVNGHLLIILSGPEPQRSILENIIVHQIAHYNGTAIIVRGLPSSSSMIPSTNTIFFYNHLPAEELNKEMQKAEFIIARSGYSTIMDIVALRKKSILIPTPGQTEQEYLAKYISEKQIAFCVEQKNFILNKALEKAGKFSYRVGNFDSKNKFKNVVEKFVNLVK